MLTAVKGSKHLRNQKELSMATNIPLFLRTQGDGMEKVDSENIIDEINIKQQKEIGNSSPPELKISDNLPGKAGMKTLGSAIKLIPLTVNKKKKNLIGNFKSKEPKFVPYEPYKAAVRPMVPSLEMKPVFNNKIKSKDVVGIFKISKESTLAVSPSKFEIEDEKQSESNDEFNDSKTDWQAKLKVLEMEIQTLKEENEELEKQLNFQVQVNGELKNLLVAAVGEDIETKVHVLTEDKLHLAQALLRSSESLTSHQEQTEWLAGQCEVWKSKFLASSVMVEELARWKASLCQKVYESHEALKKFLEEHKHIQETVLKIYENLSRLWSNFDLRQSKNILNSCNVLEVCKENLKLTNMLTVGLLGGKKLEQNERAFFKEWKKTAAEKAAEHILANPNVLQLVKNPDAACKAVVGAAVNLSGELYLQCHPPKIGCCSHCKGDIKLV